MNLRVLVTIVLCGCGTPSGDYFGTIPNPNPKHLRWCNSGEPEYIDPALVTSTTGVPITHSLFAGLAEYKADGFPELDMATDMEVHPSFSKYTFKLRKDLKWSDGTPITSADFVYHVSRILHPDTISRYAGQLWESKIKNAKGFTTQTTRRLLVDVGDLKAGTIVDVIEEVRDGKPVRDKKGKVDPTAFPNSNLRTVNTRLGLRPFAQKDSAPHGYVAHGKEVKLVEYSRDKRWAYVFYPEANTGAGQYGWVLAENLGPMPEDDASRMLKVRQIQKHRVPGNTYSIDELLLALEGREYVPTPDIKAEPSIVAPTGKSEAAADKLEKETEVPASPVMNEQSNDAIQERHTREFKLKEAVVRADQLLLDSSVLGVRAPDPYTFEIELFAPKPSFFNGEVAGRAFRPTPRHKVAKSPLLWIDPRQSGKENIVVSGPFKITGWLPNDKITLVKNEQYHNSEMVKLKEITVYAVDDQAAAAQMYYTGFCDANSSNHIPASYMRFMRGLDGRRKEPFKDLTTAPYYGIYFYIIHNEKYENVHFRRALSHGIDRSPIPDVLGAGQIPATHFNPGTKIEELTAEERQLCGVTEGQEGVAMIVRPNELCYVPPLGFGFDLEKAKSELALAKRQMGDKWSNSLELKYNKGSEGHKILAEYVQEQWKNNLGLEVSLQSEEWKTYLKSTSAGKFQVARMGWIGSSADPEGMLMIFRCGNPQNRSKYCDEEFEALMKKAEATSDEKKRLQFVRQAEEIMIKKMPVLPMYVYTQQHLQKPYVKNLPINFFDNLTFRETWIDPEWKTRQAAKGAKK